MPSLSEVVRDWWQSGITTEVRQMSQAINDRLDAIDASITAEKAEVVAAIDALKAQVAQGQLDEAAITARLDGIKAQVNGIYTPDQPQQPVENPTQS